MHPASALLVALAAVSLSSSASAATPSAAPAASAPPTAGADWPVYLGDAGATHYSTLAQITPENVANLEVAWTFRAGGAAANNRSQIQCNPLVIDGVLYGTSPDARLFALEAATGRELWRFNPFATGGKQDARGINRGLAWWQEGEERRLLFSTSHYLFAIGPATGRAIASFGENGRIDLLEGLDRDATGLYLSATTPGAIYRDLIVVPARLGEGPGPAAPGHIRAFDVRTGKRRWIFHTIPHPGELGHDTWPKDAWETVGGANVWAGIAIDRARGLAFVPTGSASFDFWGGNRHGQNLFANCLLALDAATGERKWHFQFVHHDLWDRDLPAPPVLCQVERHGNKIDAVAQVTKSGHVWVFDRETGESLFPWREVEVPPSALAGEQAWPTQPVPLKPAPFARQELTEAEITDRTPGARETVLERLRAVTPSRAFEPPGERGTIIFPGFDGGAEWGGAAVDPRGVLYINSNEMPWILTMVPAAKKAGAGATLYTQLCMSCHGAKGEGNAAQSIPPLANPQKKLPVADIVALLDTGRGTMPSFAFLASEQKQALAAHLVEIARGAGDAPSSPAALSAASAAIKLGPAGPTNAAIPYATTGYNRFLDPDGYPAVRPPWGTLNALDLNTGEYLWQRPLGEFPELTAKGIPPTGAENYGGPIVTASGVLFIAATKDEKFRAFDARTGRQLWETTLPAGGYATPATYAIDGRQYVVIACGGGKMGTKSGDMYVAFTLKKEPGD